jgi:hypothetical protein
VTGIVAQDEGAVDVRELSREEGRALLDELARRYLSMSADEFVSAWDAGELNGPFDSADVARVAMLLPFGR